MEQYEINLGNLKPTEPEEVTAKRIEETPTKKKVAWVIVAIVAVVVVVGLVLMRIFGVFDGLERTIRYAQAAKDANGCVKLYSYSSDKDNLFTTVDESLVVASKKMIMVLGESDNLLYSQTIKFNTPTIASGVNSAAIYDVGGTEVYVVGSNGLIYQKTIDGEIISVTVSDDDYMAVTYNRSGYKAAVIVFNKMGETTFEFNSAERFLMTARATSGGKKLAVVAMGQDEGVFESFLYLYRMDSSNNEPLKQVVIGNGLIYDLEMIGSEFCAVGENALYFISSSGNVERTYDYDGKYLRKYSMGGSNFITLVLGDYKSGTSAGIVTLSTKGEILGRMDTAKEILSIDANGHYLAVLYGEDLVLYNRRLAMSDELVDISSAKHAMVRDDGTVVLAGNNVASLYIP